MPRISLVKLLSILTLIVAGIMGFQLFSKLFAASPVRRALDPYSGNLLVPLLKPRVAGTEGSRLAREHIVYHLLQSGWSTDLHGFSTHTPVGQRDMTNIIAKREPVKSLTGKPLKSLTLAAHYDSKATPEGFIGATDSAFACALLLWLASRQGTQRYDFNLIFFDGEEAFENWTDQDSLYGSRALAEKQAEEGTLPSTLILLDLIGQEARFPIPSWYPQTERLHSQLAAINPKLMGGRNLHMYAGNMIDDHTPYVQRGVPVMHIIPPAFPDVWHTMDDNADILDWETMEGWADLFEKWLFKTN